MDESAVLTRLSVASALGQPFPADVPDTPANRELFDKLVTEREEIAAKGGIVEIPFD